MTGSPPLAWRGLLALGLPFTVASSPPHTWGGRLNTRARTTCDRFTPTRVGTFAGLSYWNLNNSVHPHTRGDIVVNAMVQAASSGSPPHAWGHYLGILGQDAVSRFTPTRVGTFTPDTSDIPLVDGSPPHAWGHYRVPGKAQKCIRFTPTRVGTFHHNHDGAEQLSVHPHTRGDISSAQDGFKRSRGSPPHAWGHCCCSERLA